LLVNCRMNRQNHKRLSLRAIIFLLALLQVIGFAHNLFAAETKTSVRVGVYQDPPSIWTDERNNVRGFLPDILEHIAQQEGWEIEYIPVPWCDAVQTLRSGEVDLLPGVYPLLNSKNVFALSESPVFVDWGQVYSTRDAGIQTILDLEGKKVAVETSCVFIEGESGIRKLAARFNVQPQFHGFTDARDALEDLHNRKVDAIVLGRFYNNMDGMRDDIVKTPILLNPVTVYFGAPKGHYAPYLNVIDAHIREMKANRASIYYQSWEKWYSPSLGPELPQWLVRLVSILGGVALLLLGFSLFARYQVEKKTREISEKNERLRSLSMELTLAEEDERRRLAELLHDSLGQNLALAKLRLSVMENAAMTDSCHEAIVDIKSFLNDAIRSTRSLTAEMSPTVLYDLPFTASLKWLTESILRGNGIESEVVSNGQDINLPEDAKVLLFKTVRELLVNIVKHAAASYVKIEIRLVDEDLHLVIEDNGIGMENTNVIERAGGQTGFGLLSIRERLTYLGGKFHIGSKQRQGTIAHLIVPLQLDIKRGTK